MKTKHPLGRTVLALTLAVMCQTRSNAQTWTNKANLLKQGRSFGVAVLNGKIYLAGGYCGPYCNLATTDEYDPVSDVWTHKTNMLAERYVPAAAALNGKLYAIGGANNESGGPTATVEEYDPVTNTWTNKASIFTARLGHQAVPLNGKIYVFGGATADGTTLVSVEEYDPISNTSSPKADMPTPRISFGAVALNGKIYVVGGRNYQTGIAPVHSYDPSLNSWATNASIPTLRETLATVVVNGRILAIGGHPLGGGCCESLATVEEYDPTYNVWSSRPNLPTPRNECFAVLIGETLYVFGGYDNYTMQALIVPPMLNAYTAIELEFLTHTGRVYQLQASPDLTTWTNFGPPIPGDGNFWNKTYSARGSARLFYRVEFAP